MFQFLEVEVPKQ